MLAVAMLCWTYPRETHDVVLPAPGENLTITSGSLPAGASFTARGGDTVYLAGSPTNARLDPLTYSCTVAFAGVARGNTKFMAQDAIDFVVVSLPGAENYSTYVPYVHGVILLGDALAFTRYPCVSNHTTGGAVFSQFLFAGTFETIYLLFCHPSGNNSGKGSCRCDTGLDPSITPLTMRADPLIFLDERRDEACRRVSIDWMLATTLAFSAVNVLGVLFRVVCYFRARHAARAHHPDLTESLF
jgi:hypothetical protein